VLLGVIVCTVDEEEIHAIVISRQVPIQPRVDDGGRRSNKNLVGLHGGRRRIRCCATKAATTTTSTSTTTMMAMTMTTTLTTTPATRKEGGRRGQDGNGGLSWQLGIVHTNS
jgi:hypothetical protein